MSSECTQLCVGNGNYVKYPDWTTADWIMKCILHLLQSKLGFDDKNVLSFPVVFKEKK